MKLYRYTSSGEGVFSIGKRLLPQNLVEEANKARAWLPKPTLLEGDYTFYLSEKGKEQYEATLLKVRQKYLKDIKCDETALEDLLKENRIVFQDEWQIVTTKKNHLS